MAFATIDVTKGITGSIPTANLPTIPVTKGGTGLTAGTTDQVLKFTGSTTLASSVVPDPNLTRFYAMLSVEHSVSNNTVAKVLLNNVEVDSASLWDTSNHRYTMDAANAGRYYIGAVGSMKNSANTSTNLFGTYVRKNGSNIAIGYLDCRDNDLGGFISTACNTIVDLANGDYVELYIYPYVDSVNGLGAGGSPSGVDSHLAIFRLAD